MQLRLNALHQALPRLVEVIVVRRRVLKRRRLQRHRFRQLRSRPIEMDLRIAIRAGNFGFARQFTQA
jgi:hypothetical protein